MTQPFPPVLVALRELVETKFPAAAGKVGGDLSYQAGSGLYVWLHLVPGGNTTLIDGDWIVDVHVFGDSYMTAMQNALALEAILLGPRHVTSTMRLDNCYQNIGPADYPWEDDNVYRIGATYAFTARRSG